MTHDNNMTSSFKTGDLFSSFKEFEKRLKEFEKANNVLFVLGSSKKVAL